MPVDTRAGAAVRHRAQQHRAAGRDDHHHREVWNFIYNTLFEYWESRQATRGRSVARRVAHAIGFQLTLVVYLIPLIAWWLDMTLVEALLVDMAFIILVPCYTFAYNWAFDRVFGLPSSAMATA